MVDSTETVRRRTAAHHEALAEQLVDLATEHMHGRDREVNRGWLRSRKRERWHRENTVMLLATAQVHASLAFAKSREESQRRSLTTAVG